MGHAIANTFKSVAGKLCYHSSRLRRTLCYDLRTWPRPWYCYGKGRYYWCYLLCNHSSGTGFVFDKPIEKTQHKLLLARMDKPSAFITKHYKLWTVIFLVLLLPAIYGNNHTKIYYNIAESLPATLDLQHCQ